ncbi:HyaD/HybD family hydrogenase maturation endopeptidase [Seleniivibrio woodruffii]|uniref:Hydrogenase maturation protease n=1 Tax=Seleniivibrio woodruffii TaxID=1078050 RepID=A0A4R1KDQ7_9BACT|nr:HyaD/HybD family hydrogenase maturation endopeptidase [Seleniivibrio woodruffii]TCK62133.1 hydrogenase maturation protease [Seleniivibrio woodruffii]TVZ34750.1 hydrogenase maturation protease [Seleniivibrio woodruffii]
MKLLVLGIGNLVMNDDGAGVLAVQELMKEFQETETLRIMDGGTLGLDLLVYIEWADRLIIADAVDFGLEAGTIVCVDGDDIDTVFENKLSAHQMGMKDMLATAALMGVRPKEVRLYGIQTKSIEMDMTLSPEVSAALPKLTEHLRKEISAQIK